MFLKGLYFEKVKDKNNTWIRKLKYHCQFYSVNDFYTQTARLGGGKLSEVYETKNKRTQVSYALKKIDKTKLNQREKEFLRDEI